ncbi:hypothetical protein V2J09_004200 [Rumex salicifolius]
MAQKGGDCADATEYKAVFVDTNLDTRLAIPVSSLDTISDIKRKLLIEHSKCFKEFGQIEVHALKVKRKRELYFLSDLMPVTSVFTGILKGWFLSADISGQFCQNEAVDYNTMLLTDPNTRILIAGPSSASQLQRGYKKNEGIFQADEQSGEAKSENLQLVAGFKSDENLKGSSSDTDKRLNTLVEDIYRANCGKDINSSGLVTEVTSVNPVNKSLDIGSLEENKIKKKRKVAAHVHLSNGNDAVEITSKDKDCAGRNPELMNLNAADSKQCDHVVTGEGSADQNNIKDKSSFETNHFKSSLVELRNGSGADIEQSVCPCSEGIKGIESHGRDLKDVSMGSDKTKGTAKKKSKRMTRIEVMNDDRFTDSDASANVSVKSLATPLGAKLKGNDISEVHQITYPDKATVSEKGRAKSLSLHVQGNNSTVIPFNMDEAVTEEVGRISVPDAKRREKEVAINGSSLESGMKRSKKRKNSGGDVSHQMDINRNEELGVPDNGEMEKGTKMLAESGMTRPLKRSKTGNDMPDANKMDRVGDEKSGVLTCKQQNQTPKPKKKIKQKQTPALKKVSESGMEHQNDTMELEKSKATLLKSAAGKDDNIEILSSPHKQINKVPTVVTFGADTEMDTKLGLDDILIPNIERDVKPEQEADETICSNAELQITQIEESVDGSEDMNRRSRKKMNISQFPVKDKKHNIKRERSKPAFLKLTAANNDDRESPSSCQEQVDKSGLVADCSVDIEMKKAEVGVDDKVLVSNHWSEICSPKEADENIQYFAESEQLTSIQKRERDNRSKTEKSMKKNKQKSQLLKSMSEFPVEDCNNCVKLEGSKSTLSRSEVENESLSSAAEKIDNMSLISASQADDEISTKVQQVIMANLGRDVNLQQEADNTCQNDVEPMQLTQVQEGRCDTVKNSEQTKKKTMQQKTRVGNNLSKVVKGDQDDSKNGISFDEDLRAYPTEVSLNAAKNKADMMKSKVENSSLKTKDSGSILNGTASRRVGNTNDSRTSSSHSDLMIKKSHQHKSMKELQKMKQPQSGLHKLSDTSTKKVVQNPSKKNSLISKRSSIFKDESSSNSEDKSGGDDSNSSTEASNDDHVSSSDYSEDESKGNWASPKEGNSKNGGSALNSKSMQKNLTMESVLRSSHKYKKAKLVASQSQLEEDESQAVDFVPDSQGNK